MKIIVLLAVVAVCSASPQGGLGGFLPSFGNILPGGGGSSSGGGSNGGGASSGGSPPSSGSGSNPPANDDKCPMGCPVGWNRWFGSDHCYLLPSQPATLKKFWDWNEECRKVEPTSYIAVSSDLVEQLVGSAIAIEYAPSWGLYGTNAYFWLGGYTKDKKWHFLDGSDESNNLLFIGAAIASAINLDDGTCLGADAKTLGLWQTYPCDAPRGTAFCEMKQRPVCGPQGGILPISPIDIKRENIEALFPTMYQIPYLGQILGAAGLDGGFSSFQCLFDKCPSGGGSSSSPNQVPGKDTDCTFGCPAGWYSWDTAKNHSRPSPTTPCYRLPPHDAQKWTMGGLRTNPVSFSAAQAACKNLHGSSYVMVINSLLELATTKALLNKLRWDLANPGAYLWLGERTDSKAWRYEDRSEENGNLVMSLASPTSRDPDQTFYNGKCMTASLVNGGGWAEVDCNQAGGLYFCELPKQRYCNGQKGSGNFIDSSRAVIDSTDMSIETLATLFGRDNVNRAPFLNEVLGGKGQGPPINPTAIAASWGKQLFTAPGIAYVMCVKKDKADLLQINGDAATVYGQWVSVKCSDSPAQDGFQASSTAVLSSWSRCYNKGYELAMPVTQSLFGPTVISEDLAKLASWNPFVVDTKVAEHYAKKMLPGFNLIGVGGNPFVDARKYPGGSVGSC